MLLLTTPCTLFPYTTLFRSGDELKRMSRLVDELIMLARSERPDFLVPAEADLTDLVLESFSKASALAPRRWIIDSTPEAFRSEEHTSELQSRGHLVCRLLLE